MEKKRKMSFTSVGGSSILTIFAVLCFIVFALLSLSTAKADRTLADKTVQATENYYKADLKAEEILAELRGGEIKEVRPVWLPELEDYPWISKEAVGELNPISATALKIVTNSGAEVISTAGKDRSIYSYSCPIDENQELQIRIRLTGPTPDDYEIVDWKKAYIGEWTPDDSIEVFSGVEIDE